MERCFSSSCSVAFFSWSKERNVDNERLDWFLSNRTVARFELALDLLSESRLFPVLSSNNRQLVFESLSQHFTFLEFRPKSSQLTVNIDQLKRDERSSLSEHSRTRITSRLLFVNWLSFSPWRSRTLRNWSTSVRSVSSASTVLVVVVAVRERSDWNESDSN